MLIMIIALFFVTSTLFCSQEQEPIFLLKHAINKYDASTFCHLMETGGQLSIEQYEELIMHANARKKEVFEKGTMGLFGTMCSGTYIWFKVRHMTDYNTTKIKIINNKDVDLETSPFIKLIDTTALFGLSICTAMGIYSYNKLFQLNRILKTLNELHQTQP